MNKSLIITHWTWAAVVAGAFFVGAGLRPERSAGLGVAAGGPGSTGRTAGMPLTALPRSSDAPLRASDLEDSVTAVMAEPDEGLRVNRANRLIKALTPEVLAGMSEEVMPGTLSMFQEVRFTAGASLRTLEAYRDFVTAWARRDPEAAARYVGDPANSYYVWKWHPGGNFSYMLGDMRRERWEGVIAEWAKVDLASAKDFVASTPAGYRRKGWTMGVMKHLAETDLESAMAYSVELDATRDKAAERFELPYLVEQVREQRGMDGVDQWLRGVTHVPPDDGSLSYKQRTVAALAEQLREKRSGPWGEGFVEFMVENAREPFMTADLLTETADGWGPSYTLGLLLQLPEEIGARREAIGNEMQQFVDQDPEYAGKWLAKQELLPIHDEAIQVYVRQATMDDLDAAMRWANRISDPVLKSDTIEYVKERRGGS